MRALIFDFDGLMVDTETPAYEAWCTIYREHGVELALSAWVACVGSSNERFDPVTHLEELTGKRLDRKALFARKDRMKAEACAKADLRPGVRERLVEAESLGLAVGVASSSGASWVLTHLERFGIAERMGAIVTREKVERVKPAPDLFLACARALGVEPASCLVFEDSLNGVQAAKAAGMRCVAVPGPITAGLDFGLADARFDSLAEVRLSDLRQVFATRPL